MKTVLTAHVNACKSNGAFYSHWSTPPDILLCTDIFSSRRAVHPDIRRTVWCLQGCAFNDENKCIHSYRRPATLMTRLTHAQTLLWPRVLSVPWVSVLKYIVAICYNGRIQTCQAPWRTLPLVSALFRSAKFVIGGDIFHWYWSITEQYACIAFRR
jgi:hypothetical protein